MRVLQGVVGTKTFKSLEQIKQRNERLFGVSFSFGMGVRVCEIGDIRLLEYHPTISKGGAITPEVDLAQTNYLLVGESVTFLTLDMALVGALSCKYTGRSDAGWFAVKLFDGMKEPHETWGSGRVGGVGR